MAQLTVVEDINHKPENRTLMRLADFPRSA